MISALPQEEVLHKALQQLDIMFGGREWLIDCGGCTGKGDWENYGPSEQRAPRQRSLSGDSARSSHGDSSVANCEDIGAVGEKAVVPGMLPSECYAGGLVHNWADERFVRGGYCYPRLDFDENTHADAASSVENRLFFAGEHTNIPMGMSLHAAIDSGDR